jgi:hypothetical protein
MNDVLMILTEYRLGLALKSSKYLKYLRDDVGCVDLQEFVNELKHLCETEPSGPVEETLVLIDAFEEFFKQIDALIECEEPSFDDKVKCHIQLVAIEAILDRKDNGKNGESNVLH